MPEPKKGHDAVRNLVRYAETKTHLEAALSHLHSAMAVTPWFHLVEALGNTALSIVTDLATHNAAFEDAIAPRPADEPEENADV